MSSSSLADRQKQLTAYLVAGFPEYGLPGWPLKSACASVGNATRENNCNTVTIGIKDHGSDGLWQFRLDRLDGPAGLKAWAASKGLNWTSMRTQAAFHMWEMQRDYPDLNKQLLAGKLPLETLTANICDVYERPSVAGRALGFVPGRGKGTPGRINFAYDVQTLLALGDASPSPPPPIVAPKTIPKPAAAAASAVVIVAAAAAGGVQWLGGSWWMTAAILVSGAVGLFAVYRFVRPQPK